jgi:hypothetical protein
MEVHHHAHTGRKKWTHYLWEFLMLFLAVFCGFLAENQREHYIEKQREKKFISRLLSDLREDTAFYKRRIGDLERVQKKTDAFISVMTGNVKPTDYQVLSSFVPMMYGFDVQVTTTTYDQMKSSGSLRYIHNDELTNALQKYYEILIPRTLRSPAESKTFFYAIHYSLYNKTLQDREHDNKCLIPWKRKTRSFLTGRRNQTGS